MSKLRRAFLADAMHADRVMQRCGSGYDAKQVHAYLEAKIRGRKARRPKPVRWRT